MIEEATGNGILQQMYQHWIGPELESRAKSGRLPVDFQFRSCLVRLPANAKPIVQFNEEVTLRVRAKVSNDCNPVIGDIAHLEHVEYIDYAYCPEVDGVCVGFVVTSM